MTHFIFRPLQTKSFLSLPSSFVICPGKSIFSGNFNTCIYFYTVSYKTMLTLVKLHSPPHSSPSDIMLGLRSCTERGQRERNHTRNLILRQISYTPPTRCGWGYWVSDRGHSGPDSVFHDTILPLDASSHQPS